MKSLLTALIVVWLPMIGMSFTGKDSPDRNLLFSDPAPLELILQMDVLSILNDKSEEPEYSPAQLILKLEDNKIRIFDLKIKPRGRTRRIANICEFPPLKLNLQKNTTQASVFEGQDKIKLVTHCNESEDYQNYALLEYLAYRTYNALTDYSYRVRMVNVTYRDTGRNYPDIKKSGFLIEDDEFMAERLNGKVSDKVIWSADSCDQDVVDTFSFFQFMMGNTDWWIHTRHNVDLISLENDALIPIPFDFDYAGIIDAPYAIPSPELPIVEVRDRFFKGNCKTSDYNDYKAVISLFNDKKSEIISMYEEANFLDNSFRRSALRYIDHFYEIINDPKKMGKFIDESCKFFNTAPDRVPNKKRLVY